MNVLLKYTMKEIWYLSQKYKYHITAPVAVIFLQEGNDIVSANGTFMFGEEFINLTEEGISELFEGLYKTVRKVEG